MASRLEDILEIQFNLAYYNVLTAKEFEESDRKEIDWLYSRLAKQKKDENKASMKQATGKDIVDS